jgi:sn-glycerol 3-phosphate transport system ATP-binding protein
VATPVEERAQVQDPGARRHGGVEVRDIVKRWGEQRAVDRVSFAAEAGELVVLLGPSGCGKSTTLRLVAGLETVDEGRVLIGGVDVTDLPPSKRRLAMVFQSYALFPHLSVAENIVFGLRVRSESQAEIARRLARAADLLGLGQLLERKPGQLSGGQQQRVALGRAIVAEAPLCLMDEPLSNLDAQLRHEMRREIRALQQKLGMTMIYVTHDQTEAMTMADRVILMRAGAIEQNAAPAEIYARPATVFAARFIGAPPMNVIEVGPALGAFAPPGAASLGIRPEDLRIDAEAGPEARVLGFEYLGADSVLALDLAGQSVLARLPGRARARPGDRVRLGWARGALHGFDAAGRRLDI